MTPRLSGVDGALVRAHSSIRREGIGGCWLWTARLNRQGYGVVSVNDREHLAHRFLYQQWCGPIDRSLDLDHLCRVRRCVSPDHLEPVSHHENVLRGAVPTRIKTGRCNHGHDLAVEGRPDRNGYMYCKACSRIKARRLYHAKKSAQAAVAEGPPVRSDDVKGGNAGRWIPAYRFHGDRL